MKSNSVSRTVLMALVVIGLFVSLISAAPRFRYEVQKIAHNDGDAVTPFSTQCTASAWTPLFAATPRTRRIRVQTLPNLAAFGVCLSSQAASSDTCSDARPGIELSTGTAVDIYTEATVYCRERANGSGDYLKGLEFHDSKDSTTLP